MPECNTITTYLTQHLTKAHKFKTTHVAYKVHLKNAKRYRGIKELDMLLSIKPATSQKKEIPHQLDNTEIMPDNSEELLDEPYLEAADSIEEDKPEGEELKKLQKDQDQNGEESEEESNAEEELDLKKVKRKSTIQQQHS